MRPQKRPATNGRRSLGEGGGKRGKSHQRPRLQKKVPQPKPRLHHFLLQWPQGSPQQRPHQHRLAHHHHTQQPRKPHQLHLPDLKSTQLDKKPLWTSHWTSREEGTVEKTRPRNILKHQNPSNNLSRTNPPTNKPILIQPLHRLIQPALLLLHLSFSTLSLFRLSFSLIQNSQTVLRLTLRTGCNAAQKNTLETQQRTQSVSPTLNKHNIYEVLALCSMDPEAISDFQFWKMLKPLFDQEKKNQEKSIQSIQCTMVTTFIHSAGSQTQGVQNWSTPHGKKW